MISSRAGDELFQCAKHMGEILDAHQIARPFMKTAIWWASTDFPHVLRALEQFVARPAVIKGLTIPSA